MRPRTVLPSIEIFDTREVRARSRKKKVNIFFFYGYFSAECVRACKAYYVWCGSHSVPLVPPTSATVSGWARGGVASNKTFISGETVCPAPATTLSLTPGGSFEVSHQDLVGFLREAHCWVALIPPPLRGDGLVLKSHSSGLQSHIKRCPAWKGSLWPLAH